MSDGISPDQFRANHYKGRIAELTSEYEEKIATGSLQLQILSQQRDENAQEILQLRARVQELETQLEGNLVETTVSESIEGSVVD